jgi:hypothetical protein
METARHTRRRPPGSRAVLTALFAGAVALGFITAAQASERVRCEVLTIEASRSGQGIDPALALYGAVFKAAPFAEFDTFKLVGRRSYELALGSDAALTIPSPYTGSLRFDRENAGRFELTLSLTRPSGPPILVQGKATPGTPFFAAGLKSALGRWVFGVACDRANGVVHY